MALPVSSAAGSDKDAADARPSGYTNLHAPALQREDPNAGGFAVKRPMSTEDRLVLAYDSTACCNAGPGLQGDALSHAPPALAARGVTDADWLRVAVERLRIDVQPRQTSLCLQVLVWSTLVCAPLLCWHQGRFQRAAAAWLDALNRELLAPRGMLAKFQTASVHIDKYHEEISWLAVALTPDEAEILSREPVFWSPGCCDSLIRPDSCACAAATSCCCVPRVV